VSPTDPGAEAPGAAESSSAMTRTHRDTDAISESLKSPGIHGGDGVVALADLDMLRAALLNVTINACQAAGTMAVEIRVSSQSGRCRIDVCDCGPGIPAAVHERVFEPFFTTRPGGTGLGLAIVKRLIELLNGTIDLADRPGGGTVAAVGLPLAPVGTPL